RRHARGGDRGVSQELLMRARALWIVAAAIAVLAWALAHPHRGGEEAATGEGGPGASAARDTGRAETVSLRLYYASPGGDSLIGETRETTIRSGLHGRVEGLVRELVRGARRGGVPLLPPGTAVRHVYLDHRGLMTLGLTTVRELFRALPHESVVYFGDTARLPYGTKSRDTVTRFSLEIASFLVRQNIKCLVVACNTSSSYALDALARRLEVPVVGVIE